MRFIYAQFRYRKCRTAANDNPQARQTAIPIPGFDGPFYASPCGKVFKRDRQLVGHVNAKGYRRVCIRQDGVDKNYYVHQLIALTFHGFRPEGYQIDHINYETGDNRAENLRYITADENRKRRRYNKRAAK